VLLHKRSDGIEAPGKAEGEMPSVPGYKHECQLFLAKQVEIVQPRAVIALGAKAEKYVSSLGCRYLAIKHPGDWHFRETVTQESRLLAEGKTVSDFISGQTSSPSSETLIQDGATGKPSFLSDRKPTAATSMSSIKVEIKTHGTDAWGFRLGTYNSYLMGVIEASGKSRETIRSEFLYAHPDATGKEASITLLSTGDFVGEELLASVIGLRLATAIAITDCTALRIKRAEMIRAMHDQPSFSNLFVTFLLARGMRTQADLVDQLFNSSEKRLARILLLMAEFGKPGEPETLIPKTTQETLAEMIGTTRSRVSFFMNRFREHDFLEYNGRIRVDKSLLNVILHDQSSGQNLVNAPLVETGPEQSEPALRRAAANGVKVRHHDGLKD
jgi:CRP/FNR family transcriptional regulator, cyclic AMP receptor protein